MGGPALVLHAWVAGFIASAVVGVWAAPERASATSSLRMLALGGLVHAAVWLAARRAPRHRVVPLAVVVCGALAAVFFLTQYRHIVAEAKVSLPHLIGLAASAFSPPLGWWTPQTNTVGTLFDGLVCVAVGLALARGPAGPRIAGGVAAAMMAAGIVVSASRGSWLAVLAALVVAAVAARPGLKPRQAVAGMVVAVVLLAVVATAVAPGVPWWMRLAARAGRPDRLEVYRHALTLVRDTPFTGIGAGDQFAGALSSYALLIQVPFLTYAHNLALDVWLEQGLPGLATWCGLAAALAGAAVAGERARLGRRFRGVWAGLLAIHLHGLTDARPSVDGWLWLPFFALTGLLAAALSRHAVRIPRLWALSPLVVSGAVVVAVVAGRGPVRAAWQANRGAVAQARADGLAATSGALAAAARDESRARVARALQLNPRDVSARRRSGLQALESGQFADAAVHLGEAWREDPENLTTRKAYGLASVWTGEFDRAASLLQELPGMAAELTTWSQWRASRGELALAIAAARVALRLEPAQPELTAWLARLEAGVRERPAAGPHDVTPGPPVP